MSFYIFQFLSGLEYFGDYIAVTMQLPALNQIKVALGINLCLKYAWFSFCDKIKFINKNNYYLHEQ